MNTSGLPPVLAAVINQAASPVQTVDKKLFELVDKMAYSHWLTVIDEEEQDEFLNDLELLGFRATAKRIRADRAESRETWIERMKESLGNCESGL